jgi:hypothetical protein
MVVLGLQELDGQARPILDLKAIHIDDLEADLNHVEGVRGVAGLLTGVVDGDCVAQVDRPDQGPAGWEGHEDLICVELALKDLGGEGEWIRLLPVQQEAIALLVATEGDVDLDELPGLRIVADGLVNCIRRDRASWAWHVGAELIAMVEDIDEAVVRVAGGGQGGRRDEEGLAEGSQAGHGSGELNETKHRVVCSRRLEIVNGEQRKRNDFDDIEVGGRGS